MVNMNHHRDPSVYALSEPAGGFFYVGKTSINPTNRWWEHRSRARTGHPSPVYVRMREVGIESVEVIVLEKLGDTQDPIEREAFWIKKLLADGYPLANELGRDGVPNSMSERMKNHLSETRKGKPTWIKGKTGVEAGWTEERREKARSKKPPKVKTVLPRTPRHGTRTEWEKYGCRCTPCRDAGARRNAKKRGNPNWEVVTARPLKST